MLLAVDITEKSFGDKQLYHDLHFSVEAGQKVGLIGRNGTGKTTLFHMILGQDADYQGEISVRKGAVMVSSRQEHLGLGDITVLNYLLGDLPEFSDLQHIIETYPETMGANTRKIAEYSDALERFTHLGYFTIEDELSQAFEQYGLPPQLLHAQLASLSGGQKRLVELVKVQRSRGDLALIDEPTNHMDYVAKAHFVRWLQAAKEAVLVISHDRDVLMNVDRIVEVRDGQAYTFSGNYDDYLRSNTHAVSSQVNEYDLTLKRIDNLKADVLRFQRLKEKARHPGTIKRFKGQEQRARQQLAELEQTDKPSFWIDQDSVGELKSSLASSYQKYKAQNIKLGKTTTETGHARRLVGIQNLSLGYDAPLFEDVSVVLHEGERLRLHGRNGAGKSTLVGAVLAKAGLASSAAQVYSGEIEVSKGINVGVYDQEIDERFLGLTLYEAIELALREASQPISDQRIRQLMSNYLFEPGADGTTPVSQLSGGQKARLQLIRMLINNPNLLVLDEPTNHLDLPSIEELERALIGFGGAVIYISHDSLFASKLKGTTLTIGTA